MIRRIFSIDGNPLYIERFRSNRVRVYEVGFNTFVEYSDGQYYEMTYNEDGVLLNRVRFNEHPLKIYNKVRYSIPIGDNLYAKIDYCNNKNVSTTISVDFNSKEEADNFKVPDWFGEEIIPDLKKVKAKKKSIINNKYKTNERLG